VHKFAFHCTNWLKINICNKYLEILFISLENGRFSIQQVNHLKYILMVRDRKRQTKFNGRLENHFFSVGIPLDLLILIYDACLEEKQQIPNLESMICPVCLMVFNATFNNISVIS
jgi:hypothetical protein